MNTQLKTVRVVGPTAILRTGKICRIDDQGLIHEVWVDDKWMSAQSVVLWLSKEDWTPAENPDPPIMANQKIDAQVFVSATGHACCQGMAWESPWIRFVLPDQSAVLWHSDNVHAQVHKMTGIRSFEDLRGKLVRLKAILRFRKEEWRIWRVTSLRLI